MPAENGHTPPIPRYLPTLGDTTDRISAVTRAELAGEAGNAATFLDAVATKMVEKMGGGNGGGPPRKTLLGLDTGGWTKLLFLATVGGAAGLILWYATVNHELEKRTTAGEVHEIVKKDLDAHTVVPHPAAQKQINEIKVEQRVIRESQIRQEEVSKVQTEVLKEIRLDVRRIRRQR